MATFKFFCKGVLHYCAFVQNESRINSVVVLQ